MYEAGSASQKRQSLDRYEIRIKGHLDGLWADRLAGMTLHHEADGTTTLSGIVTDQSALYGVLRTVRDLGLTLVSVTRLDAPSNEDAPSTTVYE